MFPWCLFDVLSVSTLAVPQGKREVAFLQTLPFSLLVVVTCNPLLFDVITVQPFKLVWNELNLKTFERVRRVLFQVISRIFVEKLCFDQLVNQCNVNNQLRKEVLAINLQQQQQYGLLNMMFSHQG